MSQSVVLFTAESAGNGAALEEFIERNSERLKLIVVSDIGGGVAGVLAEARAILVRSGAAFLPYLYDSWVHYYLAIRLRHVAAKLRLARRRRAPLPALCRRYGIPCIREADVNDDEVVAKVREVDPDFLVTFVFDQILREELISVAKVAVVNVHAAYLPECRGPFPVLFSGLGNDEHTGVTIHQIVDRGIDSGPILTRRRVAMPERRSVLYREHLLHCAAVDPLTAVLDDFDSALAGAVRQGEGSYYSYPTRDDISRAKAIGLRLSSIGDLKRVSVENYKSAIDTIAAAGAVRTAQGEPA